MTPPEIELHPSAVTEARKAYQEVKDYKCTFIKRERINGKLEPENIVAMQFRAKPFSVFLDWQAPRDLVGTKACYVAGRYDGKMRVHTTGVAGLLGFVSIDLNDSQVTEHSRHAITEAGFTQITEANDSSRTGTRMYSPPESLKNKPFTTQGDVYALGVLLYQMVIGDLAHPLAPA